MRGFLSEVNGTRWPEQRTTSDKVYGFEVAFTYGTRIPAGRSIVLQ